ncbi:MAG: STT3 domain-containing protein [Candidatus Micrarchaeia archaeon]
MDFRKLTNLDDKRVFATIVLIILLIGVVERAPLLRYQGLYEPDGFYYYSIITQTIANHYIRPHYSIYSGFPSHNIVAESPGLEYITVIPYIVLHYFGISALAIMRVMPILFALLEMVTAYYLTRYIVKSKLAGLLAMFFIAVSSGNIARTSALVYRGDSFITLFIMVALLLMLMALESADELEAKRSNIRRIMIREGIGADLVKKHIIEENELAERHKAELSIIRNHDKNDIERFAEMHRNEELKLIESHISEESLYYRNATGKSVEEKREDASASWWLKPIAYMVASAFVLSLGVVIWTGSPYIVVVYMFAILFMLVYSFIIGDEHLLFMDMLLSFALLLAYMLEQLWMLVHFAPLGITLTGSKFFVFYVPLLLGNIAAWYMVRNNMKIARDQISRLSIVGIVTVLIIAAAFTFLLPFVNAMVSTLGVHLIPLPASLTNSITYAVGQTTQELQKPTWSFLFGSFNVQLILAPLGIILFLLIGNKVGSTRRHGKSFGINFNEGFIAMLAYFVVTAFIQYTAIRYNSLFSVPVAIFAAYGTYATWALLKGRVITQKVAIAFIAIAFDLAMGYELIGHIYPLFATGIAMLILSALMVNALLIYVFAYGLYAATKSRLNLQNMFIGLMVALLVINFYQTYIESFTVTQADGINPQFLQAMVWMRNNTPTNSTVLTMWPDGSVVEAWAHRQSYTDSVGGENASRIYPFAHFLFENNESSLAYIEKVHPDYIVARTFWFDELGGVAVEGLVQNASNYGYDILDKLNITHDKNASFYIFTSPTYKAEMIIENQSGKPALYAYIGNASSNIMVPIKRVLFYNSANYTYSIVNTSSSQFVNETLMVSYDQRGITGGVILGLKLLSSNIFKLVYLCNYYVCPMGNSSISMRDIYMNNDTRIIKVYYNTSAQ